MFFKKIFHTQTKNINLAAFILSGASFLSALLGLIRDRLLAFRFGAGNELDVYYTAFRLPDFVSMVLIMGAISAAIIPVFSQYLVRSQKQAFLFLSNLINVFFFILIFILIFLLIFTPQIISLIAPGFSLEKKALTVSLTRIMFLSPILLGLSNIISAVLQVFQRFLITSLAPVFYNLGIIFGIIFFVPIFGLKGLAFGVVLGAFFHLLIQMPAILKLGFKFEKIFNFKEPGFLEVLKLTIPRSVGLATNQINLIVIGAIASTLSSGSIAIFNLAENLSRPLYTLIAVSLSAAAFPAMSLAFSKKDKAKYEKIFSETFWKIFILTFSIGIFSFLFKNFIVKIILQSGKFGKLDTNLTASCFGFFVLAIFAQGLILLIAKSFYALSDTKTPTMASIFNAILNLIFCLIFVKLLSFPNLFFNIFSSFLNLKEIQDIRIVALPLAIFLSAIFQFLILLILFWRKKELEFSKIKS